MFIMIFFSSCQLYYFRTTIWYSHQYSYYAKKHTWPWSIFICI